MATPMTAAQIVVQLKKWGITYKPYKSDWATHNRNSKGAWGPVNGVIVHHVGADGDARPDLYTGNSALPGPKCHFYVDKEGVVWLIGWGRTNHAGGGDGAVLQKVISEDYIGVLKPKFGQGDAGATDGNIHFYGIEIGYSGTHKMSDAQYKTVLKLCAAINEFHKWTSKSNIAHAEWNKYKWDPGYAEGKTYDMNAFRIAIKNVQAGGANPVPTPPPVAEITLKTLNDKLDKIIKKLGA